MLNSKLKQVKICYSLSHKYITQYILGGCMVKHYRTQQNGSAIWKLLKHTDLHACPECHDETSLTYLGFVETYMDGLHAKMYQCQACDAWVDMIWDKKQGRYNDDRPAGV